MIFEKIKKLAEKEGISISELESSCNIGNGTISKWNNSSPTVANLKKVADYFGVSIEYLIDNEV